jgi:hypothetical protein
MEPAGTIVVDNPDLPSPDYSPCDGTYVPGWLFLDYRTRCGGQAGARGIGLLRKPVAPGYAVRLIDDPGSADPPPDGYTVANPPPPVQLWINPVDDIAGTGTVTVTADAYMAPGTATAECRLVGVKWSGAVDVALAGDGSMVLTVADVPVGDSYHFELWIASRPDIAAESNDFQVTQAGP